MTTEEESTSPEKILEPPAQLLESSSSSSAGSDAEEVSSSDEDENESPLDSPVESGDEGEENEKGHHKSKKKRKKEEEPYKLTLVCDHSKEKPGIIQYLAVFTWLGWFAFYFYFPIIVIVLYYVSPLSLGLLIAAMVASSLYPCDRKVQPSWGWKVGAWIMRNMRSYFQMTVYAEDYEAVKQAHPAILTVEPHDIMPVGLFIFSDHIGYFSTHKIRGCLTSAVYLVPFLKQIYTWSDATDVNKSSIKRLLDDKCTATLCPGGAHEVTFMTDPNSKDLVLYLKKRIGMVKIAAEYGYPIIPTFTFNQRKTWDYFVPQWPWLHSMGRKVGFIPLIFFGVGGIPFSPPKSCPLTMVIAKPVNVPKLGPNAKIEDLLPYHEEYLEAVRRIFENNKEKFGMGDINLKIL